MLQVAGVVVMNAHSVTDMSGEGFAVSLFRKGNQQGFVRAISDQPQAFVAGFSKVRSWAVPSDNTLLCTLPPRGSLVSIPE
jgi:hypothetical protein